MILILILLILLRLLLSSHDGLLRVFGDGPLSHEAAFGQAVERVLFSGGSYEYVDRVLLSTMTWITMSTESLDWAINIHKADEALHVASKYDWHSFES